MAQKALEQYLGNSFGTFSETDDIEVRVRFD